MKRRTFLIFSFLGLSFLLTGLIFAQVVPQEVGFKDVAFSSLNKQGCATCHGESLADTHHNTKPAADGDCASCHAVSTQKGNVGVSLQRDCMICHKKSPHHETEAAVNRECSTCHDSSGVSDYSTEVPGYSVSKVTPKVSSCKNCHSAGTLNGTKISDPKDTHHGISLKGCNNCHDEGEKKNTGIRACERCHNVKSIHEVLGHVKKDACAGCHSDKKPAAPTAPAANE